MTWWKSMSLHVPGKITTPNLMHPPPSRVLARALASFTRLRGNSTMRGSDPQASWRLRRVHELDRVVLDHGIREKPPAHLVQTRLGARAIRRVEGQLQDPADAQFAHLGKPEALQRLPDGPPLRVAPPPPP